MIEEKLVAILRAVCPQTFSWPAPATVAPPYVLYQRSGTTRPEDALGSIGVANITYQVDCYSPSRKSARQLANKLRRAVQNYQDAHTVIRVEQDRDLSELTSDPALSRVNLQFRVTHDEWKDDEEDEQASNTNSHK